MILLYIRLAHFVLLSSPFLITTLKAVAVFIRGLSHIVIDEYLLKTVS